MLVYLVMADLDLRDLKENQDSTDWPEGTEHQDIRENLDYQAILGRRARGVLLEYQELLEIQEWMAFQERPGNQAFKDPLDIQA